MEVAGDCRLWGGTHHVPVCHVRVQLPDDPDHGHLPETVIAVLDLVI